MFNTTNNTYRVDIKPACSGMLQKSSSKSFFVRFDVSSDREHQVMSCDPMYGSQYVVVLQVMLFGDEHYICELMWRDDYDKSFETEDKDETLC